MKSEKDQQATNSSTPRRRFDRHPVLGDFHRGKLLTFFFDGQPVQAYEGETIAAALVAAGHWAMRRTHRTGAPRGYYCGMGHCFECRVEINGIADQRACLAPARDGLDVRPQFPTGREPPGEAAP